MIKTKEITVTANKYAVIYEFDRALNRHGNKIETIGIVDHPGQHALIGFDTSQIPTGAKIEQVDVFVYAKAIPVPTYGEDLYRITLTNFSREFSETSTYAEFDTFSFDKSGAAAIKIGINFGWVYKRFTKRADSLKFGTYINFLARKDYGALSSQGTFYTHLSEYKPYAKVLYSEPEITLEIGIKNQDYIPKKIGKIVTWISKFSKVDTITEAQQLNGELRIKNGNDNNYTVIQITNKTKAEIPAGTFTSDSGAIQIALNYTAEGHTESEWIAVNTVDALPSITPQAPVSTAVDGDEPVTFVWDFVSTNATPQQKAELQVSYDNGGNWQTVATFNGDVRSGILQGGILQGGSAAWRMRGYNYDGFAGKWCAPVNILVRSTPKAPTYVSADDLPVPTVRWSAEVQQGYQVQVLAGTAVAYDSKTVFGTAKSQVVPDCLPDGSYTVRVRVIDRQGVWSQWTKAQMTIKNQPGDEIALISQPVTAAAKLNWSTKGEYKSFYVLRDGVPVQKLTGFEWVDEAAAPGMHRYTIRGVMQNGYYTDSNALTELTRVQYAMIKKFGGKWLLLKYTPNGPYEYDQAINVSTEFAYYDGRQNPEVYISPFSKIEHNFEFVLTNKSDLEQIKSMVGKIVLYKDLRGLRSIGILNNMDIRGAHFFTVTFEITETDFNERVKYDGN